MNPTNQKVIVFNNFLKTITLIIIFIFFIHPISWFATFLVIVSTYLFWYNRKKIILDNITLSYLVFLFLIFISIISNGGIDLDKNLLFFYKIIRTSFILLFLYVVIDSKKKLLKMQYLFLAVGFVFVTVGYLEVIFFEELKNYFLLLKGIPSSNAYIMYSNMVSNAPRLLSLTPSVDSNYVGFLIAIFYNISLNITFEKMANKNSFYKFSLLSMYFFVAIVLTGSRGGLLIAILAGFLSFLFQYYNNKVMIKKFLFYIIILSILCFVFSMAINPENVLFQKISRSFDSSYLASKHSDMIRVTLIKASISMIENNPVLGVGLGNFTKSIPVNYPELIENQFYDSHNFILSLGVVGGLPAIGVFIFIFYKSIKNILSFSSDKNNYYFTSICMAWVSIFFVSLPLEYSLTDMYRVLLLHSFIFIMSLTNRNF